MTGRGLLGFAAVWSGQGGAAPAEVRQRERAVHLLRGGATLYSFLTVTNIRDGLTYFPKILQWALPFEGEPGA